MVDIGVPKVEPNLVFDTVRDFQDTGLYTDEFLKELERGLESSNYGKK